MFAKPVGGKRPACPFDIDTPYASAPALTAICPGPTSVSEYPPPEPQRWAPTAAANVPATPLHDEITMPRAATGIERFARTARTESLNRLGSGYPVTFVAT